MAKKNQSPPPPTSPPPKPAVPEPVTVDFDFEDMLAAAIGTLIIKRPRKRKNLDKRNW
jgi:hypothetical protein